MTRQDESVGARDSATLAEPPSAQERLLLRTLERAEADLTAPTDDTDDTDGDEHLLVWLGEAPYLVRLADLREVLPSVPAHIALPYSPLWLWGVFPLRTDLVALVDPAPMLRQGPAAPDDLARAEGRRAVATGSPRHAESRQALVIGEGDRTLALVAERIGDIWPLRPEDQEPSGADTGALPSRYVAGVYPIAGLERPALALHLARLCEDIFTSLEERPEHE
ncbi:MAG TPA: chemotaxis protein CheW [Ktedonobacterales bacterium]|jgi:chemotaxis signal transduction protein|nr:chemotaxis protein CheW [Ktedonobacterales bacterium]